MALRAIKELRDAKKEIGIFSIEGEKVRHAESSERVF
jgi:hypothetical protein